MAALHGVRFRCCEGRVFEVSSAIASGFLHEVRFRCCEGEGVGVAPDHERMHLPAELHRCLIQRDEERVRRPERCENFGRQISAINDMITGTRVLNAKTWRHTANPPLLP